LILNYESVIEGDEGINKQNYKELILFSREEEKKKRRRRDTENT